MFKYICLLQEKQCYYKIIKAQQYNLPNEAKLLFQMICENSDILEQRILQDFKEKYEIENEYFKGDYKEMINDIYYHIINEDSNDEIKEIFYNYKEDECFNGNKKIIKICIERSYLSTMLNIYYIDNKCLICKKKRISDEEYDYYIELIQNNTIYDINDEKFIKKLIESKYKININYSENINDIIDKYNEFINNSLEYKIYYLLLTNCIVNDIVYCNKINNIIHFDFNNIEKTIIILTINNKIYDNLFLVKYTPYLIELNDNNEYSIYNKNYDNNKTNLIQLYNNKTYPFNPYNSNKEFNELYINYIEKFNEITLNKTCINMNENTKAILNF